MSEEVTSVAPAMQQADKEIKGSNSIRVDLSKIDVLMNSVGELVIVNSMLFALTDEISDTVTKGKVAEKLKLLDRYIRELQDSVMSVRMVPMENIYSKFPKTIRDISKKVGKKVDFKNIGANVEIDKAMIEGLTDPLMHIVRNSLDHGLESPEVRKSVGKPETGTIMISAEQANGQILISISDDGGGIPADKVASKAVERGILTKSQCDLMSHDEKVMLIFAPGLSTAEEVTDLSGRGVGMDVVKTNIAKLGGSISVNTEIGVGTTMTIALPLTLAILDGLNIRVAEKHYIIPLASIVESLQPKGEMIKRIGDGEEELLMLRSEFIPVVRLHRLFEIEPDHHELDKGMLIVVKVGAQKLALFVDEFLHQQQVVVKPIDKNFTNVKGIGSATVRGDGSIGLIIDVIGILEEQKKLERRRQK
jgi:two-component system, chemotaxis family, sensor kinase CheA